MSPPAVTKLLPRPPKAVASFASFASRTMSAHRVCVK
jgi:hypothetical protein